MEKVQPIRDPQKVRECYRIAREHDRNKRSNEISWELLLEIGFNTSFRISDILKLKVKDIRGKEYAETRAQKTGKAVSVKINDAARRKLDRMLRGRGDEEYLLESCVRDPLTHERRPITRQRAYAVMNVIAKEAGIQERVGCHTLRKTFGYHYYKQYHDIVQLQDILCHTSQRDTLVYIGIKQEQINQSLEKFTVLA